MQELVLNGKTYVKATDIAKHLGYTSDYVGQLCRAGKVDAEQVGRAWYVVPDTIQAHKQTRYRGNQAKSKAAVAAYRAAQQVAEAPASAAAEQHTTHHLRVHHYEHDTTDLIPSPRKAAPSADATNGKSEPSPEVAPATSVSVDSVAKPHTFTTEKSEPIRFTGALSVVPADTEELAATSEVAATTTPSQNQPPPVHHSAGRQPTTRSRGRAVAVADAHTQQLADKVSIQRRQPRAERQSVTYRFSVLAVWAVFIGALTIGALGSEVVWQVSADSQVAMVQFDFGNITENINKYIDISFVR
ncbi:MAG TPA: hypothetical protein VKP88_00525 [Candidatus Paceibacterota bacterium]|nr:hypothetical protein [Candidatus Paceibacterota bacterium]